MEKIDNLIVIKRLMSFYNLTQTEFASKIGVHQANLSEMIRGKRACGNGIMAKIRIAFPEINTKWLETGEGEMLKPQQPPTVQQESSSDLGCSSYNLSYPVQTGRCVNLAGSPVRPELIECPKCNTVIEVPACTTDATIPLAPSHIVYGPDISVSEWMRQNTELCEYINITEIFKHATWMQHMESRAMEPRIMENTLLAMRPLDDWRATPFDGGVYGVDIARPYMIVRRVFDEGDRLRCEPFNPTHSAIYIDKAKVFDVCEIVLELKLNKRFRL